MSCPPQSAALRIPAALEAQLHDFRRRVWTIKSVEAVCAAACGVVVSYLLVFGLDRWIDTPAWARWTILLMAAGSCAVVPLYWHRWIWRQRRFDQLARLISRKYPNLGDQLLGTIELVRSAAEQARSRALCEAAIQQAAEVASKRNFSDAIPHPRHRLWAAAAVVPLLSAIALLALVPAAATNAWARFAAPWLPVERYTFTAIQRLPAHLVVAHGENVPIEVRLRDGSPWQPERGSAQFGSQPRLEGLLQSGRYEFKLPPQIAGNWLELRIGDARQSIWIEPKLRPELSSLIADVQLPNYLQRPEKVHKDVRGGQVSLVKGGTVTFRLTANRGLSQASVDEQPATIAGAQVTSAPLTVEASRKLVFRWQDEFGLMGQEPFTVSINSREDESPALSCDDLPRHKVVLDTETLHFKARAVDDFGVRAVGLEWQGKHTEGNTSPATGERLLAAGGSDRETLELAGTFNAKNLGIAPQELGVRLYVEDYFPSRQRVYSPVYMLYVLSAEQHFIWLTDQLSKWHRHSLEVRDRELQLQHANQQLRLLPTEELDQPETRRRIENQSTAERANGRRLAGLVNGGEELIRQAMRNPEFGVGHLEKWGEMLQILQDISANRMPNVAELLKQSAEARGALASARSGKTGPVAGQQRTAGSGASKPVETRPMAVVPQVADTESSQQPAAKDAPPQEANKSPSPPKLRLPVTTIAGSPSNQSPPPSPAGEKLDQAVVAQQDLLAEFEKIADELNKVLAHLEGSTLLKRLKAESRRQYTIGGNMGELVSSRFGPTRSEPAAEKPSAKRAGAASKAPANKNSVAAAAESQPAISSFSQAETDSSKNVSTIMDDMQSYFERRHYQRFKTVLDEMRQEDVVGSLRQLGDDLRGEIGMSLAQCEFWCDTLDRWADNLVDPTGSGKCPGCKSKGSLPPSIILEAMQILEGEVNLREETRGTEQARPGLKKKQYATRSSALCETQNSLSERVDQLAIRIRELPEGETEFAPEIKLLARVELVMDEAAEILTRPETGSTAIAAETEAIELLLQSKRINPRGGGGGGSSPGGGGGGSTSDSALALIGSGLNEKEVREDHAISQTTGQSGNSLPEEFRAGLDEYFLRLERDRVQP